MTRSNDLQVQALHRLLEERGDIWTSPVEAVVSWARRHSLTAVPFGTACCGDELSAATGPRYDLERYGCTPGFSPRHADLLIVAGRISARQAPLLQRLYDDMAEPKWVMALGACSCGGGAIESYASGKAVDAIVPVDVYVLGCPPRPEAILDGLLKLQERIALEAVPRAGRAGSVKLSAHTADSSAGT